MQADMAFIQALRGAALAAGGEHRLHRGNTEPNPQSTAYFVIHGFRASGQTLAASGLGNQVADPGYVRLLGSVCQPLHPAGLANCLRNRGSPGPGIFGCRFGVTASGGKIAE